MAEVPTLDDISADVFRIDQVLGAMLDGLMQAQAEDDEAREHWNRAEALVVVGRMLAKKIRDDIEAQPRGKAVAT